ncbi:peptidoglycan-recognition protein LE isoform X1 [Dendroctonus ponderosae]|uniref:peptidoglycan-recognition protein LE isoform X1 n=1 Tax=Dendroctonus ponderosae TaxID=77166 RepID=UPI002034C6CE|nr:peptidoglycan-recognition protein LE isoform X1 [Dendroctonus ponderosae]
MGTANRVVFEFDKMCTIRELSDANFTEPVKEENKSTKCMGRDQQLEVTDQNPNDHDSDLSDADTTEIDEEESRTSESDRQLVLKNQELNYLDGDIDEGLCNAFETKMNTLPRYRSNLMDTAAGIIRDTLNDTSRSRIADLISVEGGGPVHIGHIFNITEQVVLNIENNDQNCERPMKVYPKDPFPLLKRISWLAQPSVAEIEYLKEPAKYVIICHTATEEGFSQAENVLILRLMQTFHIESRGWRDIAYNFCIGSDGNAYEGRGWYKEGRHSVSYNKFSIAIAFVGCFLKHLPPKKSLIRCQKLINHGIEIGAISPDFQLVAHCQCRPTLSPGPRLFEQVKTWKNFNPIIKNSHLCVLASKD